MEIWFNKSGKFLWMGFKGLVTFHVLILFSTSFFLFDDLYIHIVSVTSGLGKEIDPIIFASFSARIMNGC